MDLESAGSAATDTKREEETKYERDIAIIGTHCKRPNIEGKTGTNLWRSLTIENDCSGYSDALDIIFIRGLSTCEEKSPASDYKHFPNHNRRNIVEDFLQRPFFLFHVEEVRPYYGTRSSRLRHKPSPLANSWVPPKRNSNVQPRSNFELGDICFYGFGVYRSTGLIRAYPPASDSNVIPTCSSGYRTYTRSLQGGDGIFVAVELHCPKQNDCEADTVGWGGLESYRSATEDSVWSCLDALADLVSTSGREDGLTEQMMVGREIAELWDWVGNPQPATQAVSWSLAGLGAVSTQQVPRYSRSQSPALATGVFIWLVAASVYEQKKTMLTQLYDYMPFGIFTGIGIFGLWVSICTICQTILALIA